MILVTVLLLSGISVQQDNISSSMIEKIELAKEKIQVVREPGLPVAVKESIERAKKRGISVTSVWNKKYNDSPSTIIVDDELAFVLVRSLESYPYVIYKSVLIVLTGDATGPAKQEFRYWLKYELDNKL